MSDDIKQQFWKALADRPYVMVGATGEREHHIPMNAQLAKDAHGAFWFFTATDNRLAEGGPAMAKFAAKGHGLLDRQRRLWGNRGPVSVELGGRSIIKQRKHQRE